MLQELGVWDPSTFSPVTPILGFLQQLAEAPRSLVVHGNYLNAEELEFIAHHRDQMSIVYCPRTHRYFGHRKYPLVEMLAADINVAIGTDSRASNPDLNLFEELKTVASEFPQTPWNKILELGTLNGAIALGWDPVLGTITPGKRAALTLVRLPEGKPRPENLFQASSRSVSPLTITGSDWLPAEPGE